MTQAIPDIKELVGEMPARGCEWPECECDSEAQWIARGHYMDFLAISCTVVVVALCDQHKNIAAATAARFADGSRCVSCRQVMAKPSDLFGPVMPL